MTKDLSAPLCPGVGVVGNAAGGHDVRMPQAGKRWRHVIINTRSSWLHGDARGFRSRSHRIHSSGDYRHRPPAGELAGLLRYRKEQSSDEVHLVRELCPMIGRRIAAALTDRGHRVVCVAVTKVHAHCLVELPDNILRVKAIVGEAKRESSRAVKSHLPGSVWSAGGTFKRVNSRDHLFAAYEYILYDQGSEAWTWSFRDRTPEGLFNRKRPPKDSKHPPRRGRAAPKALASPDHIFRRAAPASPRANQRLKCPSANSP